MTLEKFSDFALSCANRVLMGRRIGLSGVGMG